MSNRSAEISAAYDAATPGLGAGHALEAKLIGPAAYAARLSAARDAVNDAGLDAVLLGFGADMRYLTGYAAPALERLTMLVIPANGAPTLIVPRLEAGMAGDAPAMREIMRRTVADKHRMSSLIMAVIESEPFQTRRVPDHADN